MTNKKIKSYSNIGFIGTGLMGNPMAMNLLKNKKNLSCYDVVSAKLLPLQDAGAIVYNSINNLIAATDVIILSLPNLPAVSEVMNSILQIITPGKIIINTSTVSTILTKKIDEACKNKGVIYFDSPVTGGVKGARLGTLTFIVSGDKEYFEHIKPIIACMGKNIFYTGENGVASAVKLINQLLFFTNVMNVCEAVYFAAKAGVDNKAWLEVVGTGSGNSYALQNRLNDYIIPDNYEPGVNVTLALKDVELILSEAEELKIDLPLISLAKKRLTAIKDLGITDKDISIIWEYYEEILKC